jgi:FkbM family methyltransferase
VRTLGCRSEDRPIVDQVLGGGYEPGVDLAKPVVLDVGAHVGSFAVWAAERWPGCSIHCYEPARESFSQLLMNLVGLHETIACHRVAVVGLRSSNGEERYLQGVLFHSLRGCSSEYSLVAHPCSSEDGELVPFLDAANLPPCDVFKLDVEGIEDEVVPRYRYWAGVRVALVEAHGVRQDLFCKEFFTQRLFRLVRQTVGDQIWVR